MSNCASAPRLEFFAGRSPPTVPSLDLLVSEPFNSIPKSLARFAGVGFSPAEVVALWAATRSLRVR